MKSTKHAQIRKDTIRKSVVDCLLGGADLVDQMTIFCLTRGRSHRGFDHRYSDEQWRQIVEDRKQRRVVELLKKKKWISARRVGNEMVVRLDQHLLIDFLKERVCATKQEIEDGHQCLVIFDFPNAASHARDRWRRFMKRAGFKQQQLSVWGTHKHVFEDMVAIVQLLGIEKWVDVYCARRWT